MKRVRDIAKRFKIVLYHLNKICEDWGDCRGVSASDVDMLGRMEAQLSELFENREFGPYTENPYIPEEEFDNEPQANAALEKENKRLKMELGICRTTIQNIRKQFEHPPTKNENPFGGISLCGADK